MVNTVKQSTRDAAIAAATDQLEAARDISMRSIGSQLGISGAALYYHFANRQALLDAVAERAFTDLEKKLRSSDAGEPERIIHGILKEYRLFATEHPNLFGLMFVTPHRTARKFPRDFAAHRSAVFNLLWKAVEECMEDASDGTPGESLYLAHDLWALTHGQILLWRAGRFEDERSFEDIVERSITRFLSRPSRSRYSPSL